MIRVGDYFTGQMEYLTFLNDHDSAPSNAEGIFSNVEVFENPPPSLAENSALASQFTESPGTTPRVDENRASQWQADLTSHNDVATRAYGHFYRTDQSHASLIDYFYGNDRSQIGPRRAAALVQGPAAIGPESGKKSSQSLSPFRNFGYVRSSINDTIRDQILEDPGNRGDPKGAFN